jgi:hypothetical protein
VAATTSPPSPLLLLQTFAPIWLQPLRLMQPQRLLLRPPLLLLLPLVVAAARSRGAGVGEQLALTRDKDVFSSWRLKRVRRRSGAAASAARIAALFEFE